MPVTLNINGKELTTESGPTLFELADQVGVLVPTSCHRQGKCRECMVEVVKGMDCLSPHTPEEAHLKENFRLSCRTRVVAADGIVACHTMRRSAMRIEEDVTGLSSGPDSIQPNPAVTRAGGNILLDGDKIAEAAGPIYGVAVDLGTTTVVMRLLNLEDGTAVATQSFENPQRFGGTDVMARIKFDTDNKGKLLQRTLLGYMSHAIEAFPCDPLCIYEMVIAANTTMRDILFGLDVHSIGQKPYRSTTEYDYLDGKRESTSISTTAKRLRLPIHPAARVYGLPLIGSHVGADAAACLLATDLANQDKPVALMDIGTNTELLVGRKDRILAASCPAGPAFEGGAISCGMPGLDGAIEKISLNGSDKFKFCVIGNGKPEGICGSGLIDLLSELLRTGRMNELGRFSNDSGRYDVDQANNIYLLEEDVSQLAQAKGANVAGLHIVFDEYGIPFTDIDKFYLAGGFARHVSIPASRRIGLIPNLANDKIIQIGNASIAGATIALLSIDKRQELEETVKHIEHIELETNPDFFNYFVEGCQFNPVNPISNPSDQ